jgi:hypothetical protein
MHGPEHGDLGRRALERRFIDLFGVGEEFIDQG